MSRIFSCFSRQSSIDALQSFKTSANKANEKGRVSTSNLNRLIKSVKNSNNLRELKEFSEIRKHADKLSQVLKNQHSSQAEEKNAKMTEAFTQAYRKLGPGLQEKLREKTIEEHVTMLKSALSTIEEMIPKLKYFMNEASREIKETIEKLPTEIQRKAEGIIVGGDFSAFNKDAAITSVLLKPIVKVVQRENGAQRQKFDNPHLLTWTSLERKGKALDAAVSKFSAAQKIYNRLDNFKLNYSNSTGEIKFNPEQQKLIELSGEFKSSEKYN